MSVKFKSLNVPELPKMLTRILPQQGCIEVQRDMPGKEHKLHTHEVDETLIIMQGSVRFVWNDGERICQAGDVIELPSGTPHGSVALEGGATYLIAFRSVAENLA